MIIKKEISDTRFEVELEKHDYEHSDEINMRIAHDYVQFDTVGSIETDWRNIPSLQSKHAICANRLPVYQQVQIPIRAFIEVMLPILKKHEYCQPEHLTYEDEKLYIDTYAQIKYTADDGKGMIAIPQDDGTYFHMPLSVYNSIRKSNDEATD